MKLTYERVRGELIKVSDQMIEEGLDIGLVGHIGTGTSKIGRFFSDFFKCECVSLPSVIRRNRNTDLAKLVNRIYPYLPESVLEVLSYRYKQLYSRDDRFLPDFNLDCLVDVKCEGMLIVDDNAFTGKTFELWKQRLEEDASKKIYTFAITTTGNYRPDYSCIDGWRSFEWRPIGI